MSKIIFITVEHCAVCPLTAFLAYLLTKQETGLASLEIGYKDFLFLFV